MSKTNCCIRKSSYGRVQTSHWNL